MSVANPLSLRPQQKRTFTHCKSPKRKNKAISSRQFPALRYCIYSRSGSALCGAVKANATATLCWCFCATIYVSQLKVSNLCVQARWQQRRPGLTWKRFAANELIHQQMCVETKEWWWGGGCRGRWRETERWGGAAARTLILTGFLGSFLSSSCRWTFTAAPSFFWNLDSTGKFLINICEGSLSVIPFLFQTLTSKYLSRSPASLDRPQDFFSRTTKCFVWLRFCKRLCKFIAVVTEKGNKIVWKSTDYSLGRDP